MVVPAVKIQYTSNCDRQTDGRTNTSPQHNMLHRAMRMHCLYVARKILN